MGSGLEAERKQGRQVGRWVGSKKWSEGGRAQRGVGERAAGLLLL